MSNASNDIIRLVTSGAVQHDGSEYPSMAALPKGDGSRGYTLLVPSERVLSERLTLPPMSRRDAQKAIPFLLEERLAEDVSQLQLRVQRVARGEYHVWGIAQPWLAEQLAALAANGYQILRVLPDYWLLPWFKGAWTIAIDGVHAWVRFDAWHGCGVVLAQLPQVLALADAAHPATGTRVCVTVGVSEAQQAALVAALDCSWAWRTHAVNASLKHRLHEARALRGNLLAHSAKAQIARHTNTRDWWRWAGLCWLSAGVLAFGLMLSEAWYQHRALQRVVAQLQLPGVRTPEAAWARVRHLPTTPQAKQPWLDTLHGLATAVVSTPGVQLLSIEASAALWQVTLSAYSLAAFTHVKTALQQQGLHVRTLVVQTQSRALRAVITVEEGLYAEHD